MTASNDKNRNESISLFASNNLTSLTQHADNPYALEQLTTYVGTISVVTQPSFGATPAQATPDSIASAAMSFVGQAWNSDGCWVLCSNISAEAGASLPLTSTSVGAPGVANGEWIVAYNGPAGDGGNWQSMVKAGEMISFATSSTSGHITTVVSGAGASAMLVDNITYVNGSGATTNSAHDGSANDIIVAAPHLASQEFGQAVAGSVVIYELDTPTVTAATSSPASVASGSSLALSGLFTTSDPGEPRGHEISDLRFCRRHVHGRRWGAIGAFGRQRDHGFGREPRNREPQRRRHGRHRHTDHPRLQRIFLGGLEVADGQRHLPGRAAIVSGPKSSRARGERTYHKSGLAFASRRRLYVGRQHLHRLAWVGHELFRLPRSAAPPPPGSISTRRRKHSAEPRQRRQEVRSLSRSSRRTRQA